MAEDYAEDEIEYELAPVSAQLAYVQQVNKSGRTTLKKIWSNSLV